MLNSIRTQRALPSEGSDDYFTLLGFVALQALRTSAVAQQANTRIDKMTKQVHSRDPRIDPDELENVQVGFDDAVLVALQNLPLFLNGICDLRAHLVLSTASSFIVSDNPVFKYNQYCEDIDYMGITGAVCKGLQMFLPLSPSASIFLYDTKTYAIRLMDRFTRRSVASDADVDALNSMQLIAAEDNVYFADWKQVDYVRKLYDGAGHYRGDRTVVQEYGQDDDSRRSLLHTYENTPCLKLNLTFARILRRARCVPLHQRPRIYRKDLPLPPVPEPPHQTAGTVTFSRFIGRR